MKKILGLILGLCISAPVFGADVSEINKDVYLHHIKAMSIMRKQIVQLMNKENKTAEEQAAYKDLLEKFSAKQVSFDEYLKAVANDDAEGIAKEENKVEKAHHGHRHGHGHGHGHEHGHIHGHGHQHHQHHMMNCCQKAEMACCKDSEKACCKQAEKACCKKVEKNNCKQAENKCVKMEKCHKHHGHHAHHACKKAEMNCKNPMNCECKKSENKCAKMDKCHKHHEHHGCKKAAAHDCKAVNKCGTNN